MAAATSPYQSASLYVGDLNNTVTEALLFEIFKAVGPVASIRVCRDALTRRSLGYAYVNFHSIVDAERALDTLNYTLIKTRPCRIMWSHRDPSIRKSGSGNIFIKNLDKSIDNKALYDTFSTFGNILSCKVVTDNKGNSKGYGFVHYETKEAADQSIAKVHGMLLNGKIVYVGPFVPRKERQPGGDPTNFTNLYVKNLDASYTEEDLRRDFEAFGPIQSAVLVKDPKGNIAFVNFETGDDAKKATDTLNGKKLGEKELYVGRAQKKNERESYLRKLRDERAQKYQGINLYVKNLDDSINDAKLLEAFAPFGNITSCKVMLDEKDNSRGFGFVCFTSADDASKAVTDLNGSMLAGKPIYVALAERKDVRRAKLEAQYAARQASRIGQGPAIAAPIYPGTPVFYPPGPQAQRQSQFVGYPQGMPVQRRWVAPSQPGQRAGQQQFQPMPAYGMVPQGVQRPPHRQPRGNQQQGAQQQQGQQQPQQQQQPGQGGSAGGAPGGAGGPGGRNFKYTQNARNQQVAGQPAQGGPGGAAGGSGSVDQAALSAPSLANLSPEQRKELIGERLFPLIESIEPQQVPKITGMLLESMEVNELLHLLQSPKALRAKIDEALEVLKVHNQGQPASDAASE
eukprot:TRINITY_DN370_c0_g2_i1.p1 TRINITY_DN370_c0_g2~~TRINITY_DN370_c0_g2_i1.p1  ORF type:complete len:627 (+),score=148.48 TRINITY_DN370_c0_g2_i1:281-2161(+)